MKPQMTPRPRFGRMSAVLAWILLSWGIAAIAAPSAEPALRLSGKLALPVPTASDGERALLRIEYRSARSGFEEADVVASMLARMRRMDGMVADIRRLIDAWPDASATPPKLPAATSQAIPPASGIAVDIPPSRLYGLIALAAALSFIAWLMKERHQFMRNKHLAATRTAKAAARNQTGLSSST